MYLLVIVFSFLTLVSCSPSAPSGLLKTKTTAIINGKEVQEKDLIAASVVGIYNTKIKSICTGSLIAPNIVMTAAHCLSSRVQDLKIVFGLNIDETVNIRELDVLQELVLPAIEMKASPVWNPKNETIEVDTGDIALIKFKGAIPAGYKPATMLADPTLLKIGQTVTLAGYGVDSVDMEEINPKTYRKLDEAIEYGDVICSGSKKDNYGSCFEVERNGDGVLRVTTAPVSFVHTTEVRLNEKNSGTCNGDSGGPAYLEKDGVFYLFGVTSRGSDLCNEVGVYTNALVYKNWIEETIKAFR